MTEPIRGPLRAHASGVLRDLDSPAMVINAWRDRAHVLFVRSKNHSLSQVVMVVKRATSQWIQTQGIAFAKFHWQSGYGAFSVGHFGVDGLKTYIAKQAKHHRVKSFEEEFRSFLKRHQVEFDECYLRDGACQVGILRPFRAGNLGNRYPGRCPGLVSSAPLARRNGNALDLRNKHIRPGHARSTWGCRQGISP